MTPLIYAPNLVWRLLIAAVVASAAVGCNPYKKKLDKPVSRYQSLPPKQVPEYLKGSILEMVDLVEFDPQVVSGFGLVVNLNDTGDNTQIPTPVRDYMVREMVKRGFGSKLQPGFETTSPEEVLRDPRTAIVRVDGVIMPGARRGDTIDVRVLALPSSSTKSLARGELYRTDLKLGGANPMAPGVAVNSLVLAQGAVFTNPAYVLKSDHSDSGARRSLRSGWVLDGGRVMEPRPLVLRIRQPERRLSRAVEARVDGRFAPFKENQRDRVAASQDEGLVKVTIPPLYRGDWEHFAGVMTHLFFDSSPQFVAFKAKQLADAAVEPEAPLLDISFCFEGLGDGALPFITPLMTHEKPDVAFAAARAAAFLGDPAAPTVLAGIASTASNPFQVNAIRALGELPPSPEVASIVRKLLDTDQTLVRVEAYRMLIAQKDPAVYSRVINENFVLDMIQSGGKPLVIASRSGVPRIALIGPPASVEQPFNFTTFDDRLTLASDSQGKGVTIYYRPPNGSQPARVLSQPDLGTIIARLGGDDAANGPFAFGYTDVVAVIQAMADQQYLVGATNGERVPATFVLQAAPALAESIIDAPAIAEQARPAGQGAAPQPQTNAAEVAPTQSRPN